MQRIFEEYLDGNGDRAIANGLNCEGISCPSGRRPDQNRHRLADGWQGSTIRSILENPRYTGYAVFGRWARREELLDRDDVGAGHVGRFRRADASRVVRSRTPAHPAIVSVEAFTQVQLLRRSRAAGGLRTARKQERSGRATLHVYLFRGLIRCCACGRKMEGSPRKHGMYYRCPARTLTPGSAALSTHPPTVYLREDPLRDAVNCWIGGLFCKENVDRNVRQLLEDQPNVQGGGQEQAMKRLSAAEARLRKFQAAIEAGVDPAAMVEGMNQAQAERVAARAELDNAPEPTALTDAEVYAMIDSLGDVGTALSGADPRRLAKLYSELRLDLQYDAENAIIDVIANPRVHSVRVRGGTCTLATRLTLR